MIHAQSPTHTTEQASVAVQMRHYVQRPGMQQVLGMISTALKDTM
jgi:hypothetical protein